MSVVRTYQMTSRSNDIPDLRATLESLARRIVDQPGCEGVDLIDPIDRPGLIVMAEYWQDEAARIEAGRTLGRQAFADVTALCGDIRITDGTVSSEHAEDKRWWARAFTISVAQKGKKP